MCTSTEGTTRAFPDQKSCILMARHKDHEARNLETIDERAKIGESLENIGGRRFKEIMKDASVRDLKNMAHFSSVTCVRPRVYECEKPRTRDRVADCFAPQKAYLRSAKKITESKHINIDAIRLERRVEWTWALRKDRTRLPSIHIKSHEIASCSKLIPPIVECWTAGLRSAIMNATRKGVLKAINNRFTNETLLLRWARRRLRTSQWTAVQKDTRTGVS